MGEKRFYVKAAVSNGVTSGVLFICIVICIILMIVGTRQYSSEDCSEILLRKRGIGNTSDLRLLELSDCPVDEPDFKLHNLFTSDYRLLMIVYINNETIHCIASPDDDCSFQVSNIKSTYLLGVYGFGSRFQYASYLITCGGTCWDKLSVWDTVYFYMGIMIAGSLCLLYLLVMVFINTLLYIDWLADRALARLNNTE